MPKNFLSSLIKILPVHARMAMSRRSPSLSMALAITLLLSFGIGIPQSASADAASQHWVGTWSSSPVETGQAFEGQTLRQIVRISIGGDQLRVRFSNRFGAVPLVIDAASIGIQDIGPTVVSGSLRELTFNGEPSVAIAAGAKVWSDPVQLTVAGEEDLAISMYIAENNTGGSTMHTLAWQTSYIAAGNHASEAVMPVEQTTQSWFWLTGVDVQAQQNSFAVVTFGDSITEGCCLPAFVDANVRYPDQLARLLLDRYQGAPRAAVLNSGISGNRILSDGGILPRLGPNVQRRLDADVFAQSGATHVIMMIGVNDLGLGEADFGGGFVLGPVADADEIIAAYQQIIERAHTAGLKILLGTITPFKGFALPGYWSEQNEEKRQVINAWIRTTDLHDGFVDFDAALRDPNDPERMLSEYDGGDGLHPSAAGYERMAIEAERALLLPGEGRIKMR